MEALCEQFPMEVAWNILKYMRHPVAEAVMDCEMYKLRKYSNDSVYGCPYDRGRADRFYDRDYEPHYWANGHGTNGGRVDNNLTDEQIEAYKLGFDNETERRWPSHFANYMNTCDCCMKRWSRCQCYCSNCHDELRTCRYRCYDDG